MRKAPDQFVAFFTDEFMAELRYVQQVARGDIKATEVDPWDALTQVAIGLLGQVNPAAALGTVIAKELAKKLVDIAEKAYKAGKIAWDAYQGSLKEPDDSGHLSNLFGSKDGPIDLNAVRILAELLGRGLAQRYEDVLLDRLDIRNPENSLVPLARVGAKRCFGYMHSDAYRLAMQAIAPSVSTSTTHLDLFSQRAVLMKGIIEGKLDLSWRAKAKSYIEKHLPRILKDAIKQNLQLNTKGTALRENLRASFIQKFTPKGVYNRSAWYIEGDSKRYEMSKGESTVLVKAADEKGIRIPRRQAPLYGYAWLDNMTHSPISDLKVIEVKTQSPAANRYYREVTIEHIRAYLNSSEVKKAQAEGKSLSKGKSFHDFLREDSRYQYIGLGQAICHQDFSSVTPGLDWSYGDFTGVDFSGAVLVGEMSGTVFNQAYLVGVRFELKEIKPEKRSPLQFREANLGFAQLMKLSLQKADFTQADLSCANLSGSDLTSAVTEGAIWYKTNLNDVQRKDLIEGQKAVFDTLREKSEQQYEELSKRMAALETPVKSLLIKLDQIEAGLEEIKKEKIIDKQKKNQLLEQQDILRHLMIAQLNLEQFQHYCELELKRVGETLEGHAEKIKELQVILVRLETEKKENNQSLKIILRLGIDTNQKVTALKKIGEETKQDLQQLIKKFGIKRKFPSSGPLERKAIKLHEKALKKKSTFKEVKIAYEKAIEIEHSARAMYRLGVLLKEGRNILKNEEEALKLFTQSKERDFPEGIYALGRAYYTGLNGILISQTKAVELYLDAAGEGYKRAEEEIENLYNAIDSDDLSKEDTQEARYNLGLAYEEGKRITKDIEKAKKIYIKLAEKEYGDAQVRLAALAHKGGDPTGFSSGFVITGSGSEETGDTVAPTSGEEILVEQEPQEKEKISSSISTEKTEVLEQKDKTSTTLGKKEEGINWSPRILKSVPESTSSSSSSSSSVTSSTSEKILKPG